MATGQAGELRHLAEAANRWRPNWFPSCVRGACSLTRRRPSGGSHALSGSSYRTETAVSCVWLSFDRSGGVGLTWIRRSRFPPGWVSAAVGSDMDVVVVVEVSQAVSAVQLGAPMPG